MTLRKTNFKFPKGHRVGKPGVGDMAQPNRSIRRLGDAVLTCTSEAGEKNGEIVKQPRKNKRFGGLNKHASARAPKCAVPALTCSEAEVEAILSEGEST